METPAKSLPAIAVLGPANQLVRWSAGGLIGLLAAAALLVAWRRLVGALNTPLQPAVLMLVGLLMAVAAVAVRFAWRGQPRVSAASRPELTADLLVTAALLLLAASLSVGNGGTALLVFWALPCGEEGWAWQPLLRRRRRTAGMPAALEAGKASHAAPLTVPVELPHPADVPPETAHLSELAPASALPRSDAADSAAAAENLLQQLTLSQDAEGGLQLAGWLRVPLAAGQRSGTIHVAFCPPFSKTPELTLEQVDGPPSRIRVAQLLPYGVRLDLKLAAAMADPTSVQLRFTARAAGA